MIQVVAVVGPTGSGKTALGIEIADALETEIISADSMQFYRGMEIGTGAPSADELAAVKHHFIGHLTPDQEMSAGDYEIEARSVVKALNEAGKPAVVVGGSGLYVRALIDGMFDGPGKDEGIRRVLEAEAEDSGIATLYGRLEAIDPEYAEVISSNDLRRTVRALEIYDVSGEKASDLYSRHQATRKSLDAVQFAIDYPREELYARINRRVDQMLEMGLIGEIERLEKEGYSKDIMRLKSLGYREMLSYVKGEREYEDSVELMKMHTRRYAKRQLTWFRGDSRVRYLDSRTHTTGMFRLKHVMGVVKAGM